MVIDNGNPELKANIFSRLSFHWVNKIFLLGRKRPLQFEDVFPIDPRLSTERLTALLEQQWFLESERVKAPSLLLTLLKRHKFTLLWVCFVSVVESVLKNAIPVMISKISAVFDPDIGDNYQATALYWTVALMVTHVVAAHIRSGLFYHITRFGTSIRVSVTGLIYRKACRITQAEIGEKSVGLIVNLITNDAQRLDEYIIPAYVLLNIWAVLPVAFVVMYFHIGLLASLAGFFGMLMFMPLQFGIGKFILMVRDKVAPLTDSRVLIIHEVVSFMKIIKMYGWELMFRKIVHKIRRSETYHIGWFILMSAFNNTFLYISPVFSLMLVTLVKRWAGEPIVPSQIFFYLSASGILRVYVNIFLGQSFSFVPQVIHSLRRIQAFLNSDEITHLRKKAAIANLAPEVIVNKNFIDLAKANDNQQNGLTRADSLKDDLAIQLSSVSANWGPETFAIEDISMDVRKGELLAVVGPVACGKTTLLMTILQELNVSAGVRRVSEGVSFAAQIPWIFNGSVEDNILFNREMDRDRLNRIIDDCYLTRDLEDLSDGIHTLVGERGVQLSGGQRARISLARAIYGPESVVLLDDPLSAVDSRCSRHIFNRLIKRSLAGKTVILVTHATQFLDSVDRIVVMGLEKSRNGGAPTCGVVEHVGTYAELRQQGINLSVFGCSKKRSRTLSNKSITKKEGEEEEEGDGEEESEEEEEMPEQKKPEVLKEEKRVGSLDKRLYFQYLSIGLGWIALPALFAVLVAPPCIDFYQQQYLVSWVNVSSQHLLSDKEDTQHLHVYLSLCLSCIVIYFVKAIFYVILTSRSGRELHNTALFSVLRAPMRYFDTHPIGILINRFSKDTYFMDERFPIVLLDFLGLFLFYLASVTLVVISNYYFLIALFPLLGLVVLVIKFYQTTSVEIRRIEAIQRSPLLSHVSATLSGITTIRANRQIEVFESQHYSFRDRHTQCWMLFQASSRWLSYRLDMLAGTMTAIASFACVWLGAGSPVSGIALAHINNMIGGFQWCVRQATETENMMTAIERVYQMANLAPEAALTTSTSLPSPARGSLEFRGVTLRYDPSAEPVLHSLSFTISPGEKVGIVGRTGAGKSSLLQALFRLVEPEEGEILIDGQVTAEVGLHELRRNISTIPQESVLFSGSLRQNLDPFGEFSDEAIWEVLGRCQLKDCFAALDAAVQEGGANLSAGQRQLLCLARALLRSNALLVIDEATANVDEHTDQLIQATLREKFAACTVLTVAHRINTIIDSDRVLVMEGGRVAEFDHPARLLEREDGLFTGLVRETGMWEVLQRQAQASLEQKETAA